MQEPTELVLITDQKFFEKIISWIIYTVGYGIFLFKSGFHFISKGQVFSENVFKNQSVRCLDNGDIIYQACKNKNDSEIDLELPNTVNQLIFSSAKLYPDRNCLGRRKMIRKIEIKDATSEKVTSKYELGEYQWETYKEVAGKITNISNGLKNLGFDKSNKFGLFCGTSPQWTKMSMSLMNIACPVVTLYPTLSDNDIIYAVNFTKLRGIMVDEKTLPKIVSLIDHFPDVEYVVISNQIEPPQPLISNSLKEKNVYTFDYFESFKTNKDQYIETHVEEDDLAVIIFTSGTTGMPKGVMIEHKNILAFIKSSYSMYGFSDEHIFAGFLPSSHVFEFALEILMISIGSCIGYGTPFTLFDNSPSIIEGTKGDLSTLRPTLIIMVPLLVEKLKAGILHALSLQNRLKQLIFQSFYNLKLFYRKFGYSTPIIDRFFIRCFKSLIGDNLKFGMIGGACISRDTEEFANICFGRFKQVYGTSEILAALFSRFDYLPTGNVGSPMKNCEIKVIPCEEDYEELNDQVHQQFEIAVSGDMISSGYYNDDKKTNEKFVIDPVSQKRWFMSGDIAVIKKDGTFVIVDRKSEIVKLQNSTFFSLSNIENKILKCPLVEHACVLPVNNFEYFVALIIPNTENVKQFLIHTQITKENDDFNEFMDDPDITQLISRHIQVSIKQDFKTPEFPRKFHIIFDEWLPSNNLLTPTFKLRRHEIKRKYAHLLTQ